MCKYSMQELRLELRRPSSTRAASHLALGCVGSGVGSGLDCSLLGDGGWLVVTVAWIRMGSLAAA